MKRLWILTLAFLAVIGFLWWQDSNPTFFRIPDIIAEYGEGGGRPSKHGDDETELTASVWVATAYNIDYPSEPTAEVRALKAECKRTLKQAKKAGFSTIYLQVRPSCDAFYDSSLFPWSAYLTGTPGTAPSDGFDPLAYWVRQAHKRGLRLEAWINPYRICAGANAQSDFASLPDSSPAKQHPDWVVPYDGGYYFDPGNPDARQYITDGVTEIVKHYDVDGIQFDDYFYPGAEFDDDGTYAAYGSEFSSKADWRRDNVNHLVEDVYFTVHANAKNKNCVFGISPSGIWKNGSGGTDGSDTAGFEHYSECYADSVTWIQNGWVDYICPQIYWEIGDSSADFETLARWWSDTVDGTGVDLRIGLAGYKSGSSDYTDTWKNEGRNQLHKQIDLCRDIENISDAALFSWRDIRDKHELYKLFRKEF